ncbi:MAG TPA: Rrf2 family transcriptional regulator [Ferruginibacter sp.]|nr:Rrf2 family transcriptional regulator [Ferruginibacter sp.]
MVSGTCKYAIRAMLFVAQKTKEGVRVGVKEIARSIDSPEPFIAKILQDLGKRGLISSAKGPHGGFFLEEAAFKFNLADIVYAIDGNKVFTACGLGLSKCMDKKPCPIHHQFAAIRKQMKTMLQNATLGNLTNATEVGERFLRR